MLRRQSLRLLAAAAIAGTARSEAANPIQLHIDLEVDPTKERELITNFRNVFQPAIRKQPGFVDVNLLKLREALTGKAPQNFTYRLLISFQTEKLRQKWVESPDHQKAWPAIERTLEGAKTIGLLYEVV